MSAGKIVPVYQAGLVYSFYTYYKLELKLRTPMLATCPAASIYDQHILAKAKKEIAKVKKLSGRIAKSLEKYLGADIEKKKEVEELKGILRSYMAITGLNHVLPDELEEILETAKEIEKEYDESVKKGEAQRATVFMTDEDGRIKISNHMILGFFKSVTAIVVNSTTDEQKKVLKEQSKKKDGDEEGDTGKAITSKKSVSEIYALDLKWVEGFMYPDIDILRLPEGSHIIKLNEINKDSVQAIHDRVAELAATQGRDVEKLVPALLERPLLSDQMGKKVASIAMSQILPAGAKMELHLRIRTDSPVNNHKKLMETLIYGKNQGLGQWRGSGGFGSFDFRLGQVTAPEEIEVIEGAAEGWM